ncbi:uncharacterized protein LOC123878022 [Maniola jurtina]|uniref:uncharacterized protein LOC123878022 n=1 Tax=Maniola jurtina TaxID=191418 RepID=UPI001E68DCC8|nr:uncharacterized protein LOC123878022 [Maniola jurtina]
MWLYNNYFLFIFLALLMPCNFVENNNPKEILYGNIYLVENVVPSQIERKFLEVMNSVVLKKPVVIDSKRKQTTKEQDIKPTGAIVILKQVINDKHKHITHGTRLEPQKINIAGFGNRSTPNILRDKYGDACIKVAVRKCYKALIAVNNNVCKVRYKCKSSFKSYFKKKSKVGCIKEFDYSKGTNNGKNSRYNARGNVDATREGYLDACIPYMVPNYKVLRRTITQRNDTVPNVFANVLRKRKSDKKCQRLSRAKCYRACCFALNETCTKYDCSRRTKRIFNKICKEECKRAYKVKGTSDSSDSSSVSD